MDNGTLPKTLSVTIQSPFKNQPVLPNVESEKWGMKNRLIA